MLLALETIHRQDFVFSSVLKLKLQCWLLPSSWVKWYFHQHYLPSQEYSKIGWKTRALNNETQGHLKSCPSNLGLNVNFSVGKPPWPQAMKILTVPVLCLLSSYYNDHYFYNYVNDFTNSWTNKVYLDILQYCRLHSYAHISMSLNPVLFYFFNFSSFGFYHLISFYIIYLLIMSITYCLSSIIRIFQSQQSLYFVHWYILRLDKCIDRILLLNIYWVNKMREGERSVWYISHPQ